MTMNNNGIVNVTAHNGGNGGNPALAGVDTTLTKVFVGGLAWETPKEAMREHFEKYGEILEAVIISDKLTSRSKGYGFVTFKDAEAAKKACEDATPIINGRRANCNLASLGARRPKSSSTPPLQPGSTVGPRSTIASTPAANNQVQWYYPAGTPPMPYPHQHHQAVPFYSYSPTYITPDMTYNHKLSYTGAGTYMNGGHYSHHHHQVYPSAGQAMMGANALMPMYPFYHHYHQSHHQTAMGLPAAAHVFQPATTGPIATVPAALMSKPASLSPNSVCLAVE